MSAAYKPSSPSPLSFGSPRTFPFRRPESPSNSSRPSSPLSYSRTLTPTPVQSPSKPQNGSIPTSDQGDWTTREVKFGVAPREPPSSPTRGARIVSTRSNSTARPIAANADPLSKLPTAQAREMREAFQVLDRNGDGQVGKEDLVDMLANLGQDSTPSMVAQFFPSGAPQTLNMPSFLQSLSSMLAPLSSQQELVNAFAAFDEDDSGQVDVKELKDALMHTNPGDGEQPLDEREINEVIDGFKGRREFAKGIAGGRRGEVFRYQDFISNVMGAGENDKEQQDR